MIGRFFSSLKPEIAVRISYDRLTLRNVTTGDSTTVDAPFSCSHSLVSDIDILEYAMKQGLSELGISLGRAYPVVTVEVEGGQLHWLERKVITDALLNGGASEVKFAPGVRDCDERAAERAAFIRAATGKE